MSDLFQHVPHAHIARRRAHGPVKTRDAAAAVHGAGPVGRLNTKVGLGITLAVGTMWCAYVFAVIAFVSLPAALRSHNLTIEIAWLSSNFLQLILLPIVIVGQNIQAAASDKRAEQTFLDAEAVLHEAQQIQAHLEAQDAVLTKLIAAAKKK